LYVASQYGDLEVVKILLAYGANVNKKAYVSTMNNNICYIM